MKDRSTPSLVDRVRRFNRFYTRRIGALDEGHLESPYSLAEVRALYEVANRPGATAGEIGRDLGLDAGYLSRVLRRFVEHALVEKAASPSDARQVNLRLTAKGRRLFTQLDTRARDAVAALLAPLAPPAQRRVVDAMRTIESSLGLAPARLPVMIRGHRLGDMGAIVSRQAILYGEEYGWNADYEALVSRIVADFLERFDPAREHCWVAEQEGSIVGSVFLMKHRERPKVAQLRLLYVEPSARGAGLGRRLVRECTELAKRVRYRAITLWTNSVLETARRIYEAEGYRLIESKPHRSFGHDLVGQTWELDLGRASS